MLCAAMFFLYLFHIVDWYRLQQFLIVLCDRSVDDTIFDLFIVFIIYISVLVSLIYLEYLGGSVGQVGEGR